MHQSRGKVQGSQEKVQCRQEKVQRKYEKVCQSELSAGGTKRDVENIPKCTCLNCIPACWSSLGPPPVGQHRTYNVHSIVISLQVKTIDILRPGRENWGFGWQWQLWSGSRIKPPAGNDQWKSLSIEIGFSEVQKWDLVRRKKESYFTRRPKSSPAF